MTLRQYSVLLVAFAVAWFGAGLAAGFAAFGQTDAERIYACRTPTVTTTNVMPSAAPTVETHAGYTRCRRIR